MFKTLIQRPIAVTMVLIAVMVLGIVAIKKLPVSLVPDIDIPQITVHWDSPGENTGVGCHFLLQCMKVKSESEVAQSRPTLSNPMDCSPPGSSIHGIFQARVSTT